MYTSLCFVEVYRPLNGSTIARRSRFNYLHSQLPARWDRNVLQVRRE